MNNPFSEAQMLSIIQSTVAELLGRPLSEIPIDAALVNDLDLDSLDFVELTYSVEKRLNLSLPKRSILDHAVEGGASKIVLDSEGRLTEMGLFLLGNSFYRFAPEQIRTGMYPADVMGAVTIRNWACLCHEIFNYLPEHCPQCRHHEASVSAALKVVCASCSLVMKPMPGDEALEKYLPPLLDQWKALAA